MAVHIEVNVDPTKGEQGFKRVGDAGAAAADRVEDASARSGNAQEDAARQAARAAEQAANKIEGEAEKAYDAAADASEQSANRQKAANDRAADSASGATGQALELNAALEIGKKIVEGFSAAFGELVEDGNEGALKLQGSFEKLRDAGLELGRDKGFQELMQSTAQVIEEDVLPAVLSVGKALLSWRTTASDFSAGAITSFLEFIGVYEEGTSEMLKADQERREEMRANSDDIAAGRRRETDALMEQQDILKEISKIEKSAADEARRGVIAEIDSRKHLQDIIDDSKEQLADKDAVKNKEKQLELLDNITQATKRLADLQKESRDKEKKATEDLEAKAKDAHAKTLERIKERERQEVESRQRILDAEIQLLQGILKARDDADKAQADKKAGDPGTQGLAQGLGRGTEDEKQVFDRVVRTRVKEAEERAKADIESKVAKAEEDARKSGADEEGVKEYAREARKKAIAENRNAGAKARKDAVDDWRKYKRGEGDFEAVSDNDQAEIARKNRDNIPLTQDEEEKSERIRNRSEIENRIGEAKGDIITRNVEEANKVLARQQGLSRAQMEAAKESLRIAEQIARNQAALQGELDAFREWQKSVAATANAVAEKGRREAARRNGS